MAYNAATITANEPLPEGKVNLRVRFTGNAGELPRDRNLMLDGSATLLSLRQWAIAQVVELDAARAAGQLATFQVGQTINLAAIAPPAATAFEIWVVKTRRLVRARQIGLTNVTAVTEITALQSDVDATFVAGYIGQL